jgi:hypothetical protein
MLARATASLVVMAALAGCGGAPPSTDASAASAQRAASAPLDVVSPRSEFAVRVHAARFRATALYAFAMRLGTQTGALDKLDEKTRACGFNPIEVVEDLVVAGAGGNAVVSARLSIPVERALSCLEKLDSARATFMGRRAVTIGADAFALEHRGLLLLGDAPLLKETLAAPATRGPLAAKLEDAPNQLFVASGRPGRSASGVESFDAAMKVGPTDAQLEAALTMTSAAEALQASVRLNGFVNEAMKNVEPEQRAALSRLRIGAEGRTLRARLYVKGGEEVQVGTLATISATAIYGVRAYLAKAKTAEARATVKAIGRALVASAEAEDANGRRGSFPPSARAVPKTVPSGTKYQSAPSEWQTPGWRDIRFQLTGPQYYQYEFVTSPDRRRVTVRARGDLDGDGNTSSFELTLTIDAKGNTSISNLEIKDELE